MYYKPDYRLLCRISTSWVRNIAVFATMIVLAACAHPITINPSTMQKQSESRPYSERVVGYVITDADRAKEVTTPGGGGDKITYFPYRDLEKGLRDVLKFLYRDVVLVRSLSDFESINRDGVGIVFTPEIHTTSSSDSAFTWPPTQFAVDLSSTVTDATGNTLARVRAFGQGTAQFSEFKNDFGLAGRRAAQDAFDKLIVEIRANPRLK